MSTFKTTSYIVSLHPSFIHTQYYSSPSCIARMNEHTWKKPNKISPNHICTSKTNLKAFFSAYLTFIHILTLFLLLILVLSFIATDYSCLFLTNESLMTRDQLSRMKTMVVHVYLVLRTGKNDEVLIACNWLNR